MNLVWLFGMGVFAGFLLLTGATVMISGHVMRAVSGVAHHTGMWKVAGLFCCVAGLIAILANMAHIVFSHAMPLDQALLFDDMLFHGGFAIAIAGGYVFVLGIMFLIANGSSGAYARSQPKQPCLSNPWSRKHRRWR